MEKIGLAKGTVRLQPHQKAWERLFQSERRLLQETVGDNFKNIQHVGSTSIPGIHAKPIIDIAALVDDLNVAEKLSDPLAGIGYWYKGQHADMPNRRFFAKGPEENRTIYLHIVNQSEYDTMLKFRDKLISSPRLAKEYDELKQKLAAKHSDNRESYTAAKNDFIQAVIQLS